MDKKGFFKMSKVTLLLLAIILILDIVMFLPGIYDAHTSTGTSLPYVIVNIVLFAAPCCALIDGFIKNRQEEKNKK